MFTAAVTSNWDRRHRLVMYGSVPQSTSCSTIAVVPIQPALWNAKTNPLERSVVSASAWLIRSYDILQFRRLLAYARSIDWLIVVESFVAPRLHTSLLSPYRQLTSSNSELQKPISVVVVREHVSTNSHPYTDRDNCFSFRHRVSPHLDLTLFIHLSAPGWR